MRPVDRLVASYLVFTTALILLRWSFWSSENLLLLVMHGLVATLLFLFMQLRAEDRIGRVLHDIYPLLLLPVFYTELGTLTMQLGVADTLARDAIVQAWEAALFGGQVSYQWIRDYPSVLWSWVFHLAYLSYYPLVLAGPILLLIRGEPERARSVLFTTILAFIACYAVFALWPVAGPNYAFEHPTGPVRDVWSARLVYGLLGTGSSFGTAFPSSHVAATVAANIALWHEWRRLATAMLLPTILLVLGTVYCQMHYGVDAVSGLLVGTASGWIGSRVVARGQSRERRVLDVHAARREIAK